MARLLFDDFERADTVAGTLGTAVTGQAWALTGSGYLTAKITSGRYVCPLDNSYAFMDVVVTPTRLDASVSWSGTSASVPQVTMIASPYNTLLETMLHVQFYYSAWLAQIRVNSGSFDTIASGSYASACALDGTAYPLGWDWDGANTLTLRLPDGGVATVSDSRLALVIGRWVTYQIFGTGGNTANARFDSVSADSAAVKPTLYVADRVTGLLVTSDMLR